MESASKVEAIKEAIKQLMTEEMIGNSTSSDDDNDDDRRLHRLLLAKLMSQLEEVEEEEEITSSSSLRRKKKKSNEEEEEKKILKEIKKVGRQNVITQCLVSVMILLTVAWQISEVSLIFKLKNGVTQPFRSFATIFKSIIKPPPPPPSLHHQNPNHHDHHEPNTTTTTSTAADTSTSNLIESTPVHDLNLPNLINLPKIGFNLAQQQD